MKRIVMLGVLGLVAVSALAPSLASANTLSATAPSSPPAEAISAPSPEQAVVGDQISQIDSRSGFQSSRGGFVTHRYKNRFFSAEIGGRAYAEGSRSQRRGRAWFGLKGGYYNTYNSFSRLGTFHHYRTEISVFVGGTLRQNKWCKQSNTCTSSAFNSTRHVTTKARFCADYKDDGKGTQCTPYSVVTRY